MLILNLLEICMMNMKMYEAYKNLFLSMIFIGIKRKYKSCKGNFRENNLN